MTRSTALCSIGTAPSCRKTCNAGHSSRAYRMAAPTGDLGGITGSRRSIEFQNCSISGAASASRRRRRCSGVSPASRDSRLDQVHHADEVHKQRGPRVIGLLRRLEFSPHVGHAPGPHDKPRRYVCGQGLGGFSWGFLGLQGAFLACFGQTPTRGLPRGDPAASHHVWRGREGRPPVQTKDQKKLRV